MPYEASPAKAGAQQRAGGDWTPAFAGEVALILNLFPHPDSALPHGRAVSVQVIAEDVCLALIYSVDGDVSSLVRPPPAKPYRTDGLWRSTCFELFVQQSGTHYMEFNFSPSSQWAAYGFTNYRTDMSALEIDESEALGSPPRIWIEHGEGVRGFHLGVSIGAIPKGAMIGLSAVIEETDGAKSFWALAHGDGPPDFHNPACFAARLPAPERP